MRHPMLLIASAVQGGGKSYRSLKQCLYQAYFAKHRRSTLIFDTNGEYGEYEIDGVKHRIQPIQHDEIIKFGNNQNPEVRRLVPRHPNGAPMSPEEAEKLLIRALHEYRGGTLLIEDTNAIFGDALPDNLTSVLVNVRHRNCDVILHVQSIGRLVPKLRQNAKIIRYHYQLDTVEDSAEKFKAEIEIFYIAEKLVWNQYKIGNKRFYVYIWREDKKIKGLFSPKMFSDAIQEYLSEHSKPMRPFLSKTDANGKKVYNYQTALLACTRVLFEKYYGNPLPQLPQRRAA